MKLLLSSLFPILFLTSSDFKQENYPIPDNQYVWDHFTIENAWEVLFGIDSVFRIVDSTNVYSEFASTVEIGNIIISLHQNGKPNYSAIGIGNKVNKEMFRLIKEIRKGDRVVFNSIKLRVKGPKPYALQEIEFLIGEGQKRK